VLAVAGHGRAPPWTRTVLLCNIQGRTALGGLYRSLVVAVSAALPRRRFTALTVSRLRWCIWQLLPLRQAATAAAPGHGLLLDNGRPLRCATAGRCAWPSLILMLLLVTLPAGCECAAAAAAPAYSVCACAQGVGGWVGE
jgi:hypothetical protein